MARPRPPWWFFLIAASLAGYLALTLYADVFGPGTIGAALRFESNTGPQVTATAPGYPADRAGIRPGDRIDAALGQPVRTLSDWLAVTGQMQVDRPFLVTVERGSERLDLTIVAGPHWQLWTPDTWLLFATKAVASLLTLALAILIGWVRWDAWTARLGAWFLGGTAVTNFVSLTALDPHVPQLPYGAYAIWRSLPVVLGAPLWIGQLAFAMGPVPLVLFFLVFPQPLVQWRSAWLWGVAAWLVLAFTGTLRLVRWSVLSVYTPHHVTGIVPAWFTSFVGITVFVLLAAGLACLVANYRRTTDPNDRRRVRVLAAGAFVGFIGPAIVAMSGFFTGATRLQALVASPVVRAVSALLFLVFPVSFAYAVVRHRMFDIRILVRRGLQYAFARRLLLSIVPACAVALVLDLLVHGDQPLRSIVAARGWIYAVVAGLALVAHARRAQWLGALDRRFFRERYDAQRLVRQIVEDLRHETTITGAAPRVVSQIEAAIHPEFAALLVRAPGDTMYRPVAAAPPDRLPPPVSAASKLVTLVGVLSKPVDVSRGDSGWMAEQLPHDETEFVRRARIGLLVPVSTADGGQDALLALGVKRSEEPYSQEDQELMATLAGSLALVVGRPSTTAPAPSPDAFAECPRCGECYDSATTACAKDEATLVIVRLPRVLAQRYRLERRFGHGGMGTVYEATDAQLERQVAVKVIREELVASGDAAERFRREARAAAAFSHPNVVTVHDFGVAGDNRAFLVMELLRGATLREALQKDGRFPTARALALMRDLCAAIDAAHRRPLVHRDLKPENVFLVSDGPSERAKVLDFGIAKVLTGGAQTATQTSTGAIIGTLHYMGPEQLRGGTADPSWDLWALGVIAYETLTGALPFTATTAVDYQTAVLTGRFTPVSTHLPDAPRTLEPFFTRALAQTAAERPPSAPHLLAELEQALGRA
jgi:hypothetical protein